jgi:hypothetical protein
MTIWHVVAHLGRSPLQLVSGVDAFRALHRGADRPHDQLGELDHGWLADVLAIHRPVADAVDVDRDVLADLP